MVKFNIVKILRAGKIHYAAKSSSGTIRRDSLEELEKAIEEYNKRVGESSEEGETGESEVGESSEEETKEDVKQSETPPAPKKTVSKEKRSTGKKARKAPQKFSGYRG